jgi:hypothetical protein
MTIGAILFARFWWMGRRLEKKPANIVARSSRYVLLTSSPIATDLLKDKKKVTVRFEAKNGEAIPGVFGIRMVRADAER